MGNIKDLREIKAYLKGIKQDMSVYSQDMPNTMFDLYKQTPTSFNKVDLPDAEIRESDYINHFTRILRHISNHELTKTYLQYVKDHKGVMKGIYDGTPQDYVEYSSQMGQLITHKTFNESEFIKQYLPNLCKYLYELLSIKAYSSWQSGSINQGLFYRRFYNISRYIWDLHVIDELSKPKLFLDIDKTNKKLEEDYTIILIHTIMIMP